MPEYDQPQRGRASGAKFGVAGFCGLCAAAVTATCGDVAGRLLAGTLLDPSAGFALGFWAGFVRDFGAAFVLDFGSGFALDFSAGFLGAFVAVRPGVLRVLMR